VAALAGLSPALLAHGGAGGAIVESALVVTIAIVFIVVWLRGRRRPRSRDDERSD
jgi:hypothetical protein